MLAIPISAIFSNDTDDTATRFWVRDTRPECLDDSQAGYCHTPGAPGNKTAVFFLEGVTKVADCVAAKKTAKQSTGQH